MDYRAWSLANELVVDFRDASARLQEVKALKDFGDHPHGELVVNAVQAAAAASGLEAALAAFEQAFYDRVTLSGEHDIELLRRRGSRYITLACGSDDENDILELELLARAEGLSWRAFEVGIGASAFEIFISVSEKVAAAVVAKFVEQAIAKRPDDVQVSADVAIAVASVDAKLTFGDNVEFEHPHALPTEIDHAKYEVVLKVCGGQVLRYLVRANGEIAGRPAADSLESRHRST